MSDGQNCACLVPVILVGAEEFQGHGLSQAGIGSIHILCEGPWTRSNEGDEPMAHRCSLVRTRFSETQIAANQNARKRLQLKRLRISVAL